MSARAVIVVLLVATGVARAEPLQAGFGFGGSFQTIGGDFYRGGILQVHLARRLTRWLGVSCSAELASAMRDVDTIGGIARGLAGVEVHLLAPTHTSFLPELVVALGTGSELVMWDRGTLTRATSYVGFEWRGGFAIDSDFLRNLSSLSGRLGIRGQLAPGVARTTVARLCSACEENDTPERGIDLGVVLYMGLSFGR